MPRTLKKSWPTPTSWRPRSRTSSPIRPTRSMRRPSHCCAQRWPRGRRPTDTSSMRSSMPAPPLCSGPLSVPWSRRRGKQPGSDTPAWSLCPRRHCQTPPRRSKAPRRIGPLAARHAAGLQRSSGRAGNGTGQVRGDPRVAFFGVGTVILLVRVQRYDGNHFDEPRARRPGAWKQLAVVAVTLAGLVIGIVALAVAMG